MLEKARKDSAIGEEWIHVYGWLRPFAVHLTQTQHCLLIGYTPIQNKKLKQKTLLDLAKFIHVKEGRGNPSNSLQPR